MRASGQDIHIRSSSGGKLSRSGRRHLGRQVVQFKDEGESKLFARMHLAEALAGPNFLKMQNIIQAYDEHMPPSKQEFMPEGLADGSLESAKPFQKFLCCFLEDGPVTEANGLYIQGEPGIGKTTAQKLLFARYPGQVYEAPICATMK